jgi:hypothetical protein
MAVQGVVPGPKTAIELDECLAAAAREWRAGDSQNADTFESARRFADALESWVAAQLPVQAPWTGRWFDGLLVDDRSIDATGWLAVSGRIFRVQNQLMDPLEVRIDLAGVGLRIEVWFGDATLPDGVSQSAKLLPMGTPRAWVFHSKR